MGCFGGGGGGGGGNPAGDEANRLQREQTEKQYEYDKKVYDFNWEGSRSNPRGQMWKEFNYKVEGLQIAKENSRRSRNYQNQTAMQNWEQGVAQQDYQFSQQNRAYTKSEEQYGRQLTFNEAELGAALDRERDVLNEQFIETAFDNQSLIQELYEGVGGASYDKAAALLGLETTKGELVNQKNQALTRLKQDIGSAQFEKQDVDIQLKDAGGKTDYTKQSTINAAIDKEQKNRFKKLELDLDYKAAKTKADYENDLIRRELSESKSKAAFDMQEAKVKNLQQVSAAGLTQAGRSQGKAVQMVLAELGRQQAYTVESIVRGEKSARQRMKQNQINARNTQAKAALGKVQADYDTLTTIKQTEDDIKEADRDLRITGDRGQLDLGKIRKGIEDARETTKMDVSEVARNLKQQQKSTGMNLKQLDWNIDNLGKNFNQNQAVLKASLDSAVKATAGARRDIALGKYSADLEAEARRMLAPTRQPRIPQPINIPETKYQDPLEPAAPPQPIKGALARDVGRGGGGFAHAASSVVGGVSAGLAAGAVLGPIGGVAVGLGTMLFG